MTVYWDLTALFNGIADYLLLVCAMRLSGRDDPRLRLFLSALFGAAYAVAQLAVPQLLICAPLVLCAMGAIAFRGTGHAVRLTALFALLSCALAGIVVLLGTLGGSLHRMGRGILTAELPWGVFLIAAALTWLLLGVMFRGSARHTKGELLTVTFCRGGKSVTLRLLRDSGNTLCDPQTGRGVPVVDAKALAPILDEGTVFGTIAYRAVGTPDGRLRTVVCDLTAADGQTQEKRLIALADSGFSYGAYAGVWYGGEEREESYVSKALV